MSNIKAAILNLIETRNNVTFAEMARDIPGFTDRDNGLAICHGRFENIIYWVDVSPDACEALRELRAEGKIHTKPTGVLTYVIDGTHLNMPVLQSLRPYKTPHWSPVVHCRGPMPADLQKQADKNDARAKAKYGKVKDGAEVD